MSLVKGITYGKEHRKAYRGAKAIFCSCRNHGGCDWCKENRLHKFRDKGRVLAVKTNDVMDGSL